MTVAAILRQKGSEVAAVRAATSVPDVLHVLAERGIGAVLVQDADGSILGILSERDVVRCLAVEGAATLDRTASDLMTRVVRTATPRTTVAEAMEVMTTGRVRHLPVLDGSALVGIVSIGDVVKARIDQQEHEVDSLKAYVAGAA